MNPENGSPNTALTIDRRTAQDQSVSIFSSSPEETISFATRLANALKPIIEQQGMFSIIGQGKHVKAEGWLTLGAMLGILPRETDVRELQDGSYEAKVDLVNKHGAVVGGASALCGMDEPRWRSAHRYARRSMAITRATVKAYRISFSWIIQLAGYNPTPAEEMPETAPIEIRRYAHASEQDRAWIKRELEQSELPRDAWPDFSRHFNGQVMSAENLWGSVKRYINAHPGLAPLAESDRDPELTPST